MKVYCKNCFYCRYIGDEDHRDRAECLVHENCVVKHDWYSTYLVPQLRPSEINQNNDCKFYCKN